MKNISAITFALSAFLLASNSFAGGINTKEKDLRARVIHCTSDIQNPNSKTSINGKTPFDVSYGFLGGVYKYCSSAANNTRKMITPGFNQQERWEEQYWEAFNKYMAMTSQEMHKPAGMAVWNKMRDLLSPNKLDGRHAQSKLIVYRQMMNELDKLDALLPSIEGL